MVEVWFRTIEEKLANSRDTGQSFGACMLPNPNGGPPICEQLDQATCANLGGTYLGGDCGSAQEEESRAQPKGEDSRLGTSRG
jgi:hypothetical protein